MKKITIFLTVILFYNIALAQDGCRKIKTSCDNNPTLSTCSKTICDGKEPVETNTLSSWVKNNNIIGLKTEVEKTSKIYSND